MRICVYCASSESIPASFRRLATAVGERIAADGHALVSGGGRVSMMGDVARAARAGGAHTTGVIPRALLGREVADAEADELVVVETMRERKREMDERSDAFLALPGGLGTLEELLEVWTARSLDMHAKPVVVLDPDGFFDPLWAWLDKLGESGFVGPAGLGALTRASTLDAALEALTAAASAPSERSGRRPGS